MVAGHGEMAELSNDAPAKETQHESATAEESGLIEENDEYSGRDLVRRKAQSLDLLAELLSDDDVEVDTSTVSSGDEMWVKPAQPSGEADGLTVVPPDDLGRDASNDEGWSSRVTPGASI